MTPKVKDSKEQEEPKGPSHLQARFSYSLAGPNLVGLTGQVLNITASVMDLRIERPVDPPKTSDIYRTPMYDENIVIGVSTSELIVRKGPMILLRLPL